MLFCRYLRTLKGYVRNKARPEGSIAKGYLSEECMHFCSRYLKDIDTTFHSKERNFHGVVGDTYQGFPIFKENGKFISKAEYKELSIIEHQQAHFFVLKNCEKVCP